MHQSEQTSPEKPSSLSNSSFEVPNIDSESESVSQAASTSNSPKDFPKSNHKLNKLSKRLRREVGLAITDFNMIEDGDKIMVCLSGGKDSYVLLDILMSLQKYAPVKFELLAVNLDQEQPGFPKEVLPNYFESVGVPYRIINEDTHSLVKSLIPEGKTTCSLCSRLRRGILYRVALEEKCTKIALGHHRDDMVETLFLNMFFAGNLQTMPPKLVSDNGVHTVIRPLAYCREKDIEKYAKLKEFPIIPCNLCGSQPNLQRQAIKQMLQTWDKQFPGRIETIFRSMQNIKLSHMLDRDLYDFIGIASMSQEEFNPHHFEQHLKAQESASTGRAPSILKSRAELEKTAQLADDQAEAKSKSQADSPAEDKSKSLAGSQKEAKLKSPAQSQAEDLSHSANQATQELSSSPSAPQRRKSIAELQQDDELLDQMASDELFGATNYDSLAQKVEEQALAEENEDVKINGLNIKQL